MFADDQTADVNNNGDLSPLAHEMFNENQSCNTSGSTPPYDFNQRFQIQDDLIPYEPHMPSCNQSIQGQQPQWI